MKKYITPIAIAVMTILMLGMAAVQADTKPSVPQLYAVNFYADWCGNCKKLDPEFEKALEQGAWNETQIKFITLDLTDKLRIGKAVEQAKAEGVYAALKANGAKTGSIVLLDGISKKERTRFHAGDTADEIHKAITDKLAQ